MRALVAMRGRLEGKIGVLSVSSTSLFFNMLFPPEKDSERIKI